MQAERELQGLSRRAARLCSTHKDQVNADLLQALQSWPERKGKRLQ
jgi:hypothetical protein